MAEIDVRNAAHVPLLTTSFAWRYVLVFAGANQAGANPYFAPITNEENISVFPLASGNTVVTPELMRYNLLYSINPGSTSLQIRSDALNGYTRIAGQEISFFVQRRGAGVLAVNFTDGAVLIEDNNVDPTTLGAFHRPVRVWSPADLEWYMD